MSNATTQDLIAEYDARIAGRWTNCQLGSSRAAGRQSKIDAIVDELESRADAGDDVAERWFK